jgi:uncharacterized membrane protein
MREWLINVTEPVIVTINLMALIIIAVSTAITFISACRFTFRPAKSGHELRMVWLRYARWLVAGLTFQLAADIIESAIAETWESVGRLAAIAVVRTFLDYFLGRDVAEIRERDHARAAESREA